MLVLRPVRLSDLDDFVALVHHATFGLSTLPPDREHLAKRIRASLRGFDKAEDPSPGGETYMFVLIDTDCGKVVGSSAIVSKVGGFEPFYAYRLEKTTHESKQLGIRREIDTLHLVADHNGPSEIGSLFLHPDYRGGGNGRVLSLARFLFIADHRPHFDDHVLAEMRGVVDDKGRSPFWEAIGRHFFQIEFPHADYLSVMNKRFIADLMPQFPIYVPLLPPEAQAVIGKVHPHTAPALRILEQEGFAFHNMVDIFEAGPVVRCATDQIRTVRQRRHAAVEAIGPVDEQPEALLVSNGRRDFRACRMVLDLADAERATLSAEAAAALEVKVGDRISYVSMKPATP